MTDAEPKRDYFRVTINAPIQKVWAELPVFAIVFLVQVKCSKVYFRTLKEIP